MIGWLFILLTVVFSGVTFLILEAITKFPELNDDFKKLLSFILLTVFTTYWGKLNNPDFEFKTFFKMIFLLPRRLQWSLRISFSYLVRIKIDDEYILVRNGKKKEENLKNKFQPVGGVYKMLSPKEICKKFNLIDDNMKDSPSDDLRKRLKNPLKIFSLLKWFHSKEGIEAAPFREFFEELIRPGILPVELFSNAIFNKVDVKKEQIVWSDWNQINEYKIFEIYDLHLNHEQVISLRKLKENGHEDIKFVRRDDIIKYAGRETPWGFGITEHSPSILE